MSQLEQDFACLLGILESHGVPVPLLIGRADERVSMPEGSRLTMHVRSPELRPTRAHPDDSGLDLHADLNVSSTVYVGDGEDGEGNWSAASLRLFPGERTLVRTGVHASVAPGYEIQVRARSGVANRHGVTMTNGIGTVDCSYRGEVMVQLINHGSEAFVVRHGDRVAQMVVARVSLDEPRFVGTVMELGQTARGAGGHGSTGV